MLLVLCYLVFNYEKVQNPKIDTDGELENYITVGKYIRNDPGFSGSPLHEFEKIALDAESYFENEENMKKYKVCELSIFNRPFIALAAPSFEGKTQSAFVFKSVRPLYFIADSRIKTTDISEIQPIYLNYQSVSKTLIKFAEEDYRLIEKDEISVKDSIFSKVSGCYLSENHKDTKFWVLGFLKELINDARRNFDTIPESERLEWMKYHAHRKDLFIESASIKDFASDGNFFKGYCLFLDEFVGDIEKVLIRNLSRLIGLRCIVANTNAIIANLTGKIQSSMSRTSGYKDVWSIVIAHLNSVSLSVLENVYHISNLIEKLLNRCDKSESAHFKYFTDLLAGKMGKISLVRPGLIGTVIKSIKDSLEKSHDSIRFRPLLEEIIKALGIKISGVKTKIGKSIDGTMANLSLFTLHAYVTENLNESLYHRKSFLADHLFYLINPVHQENMLFLTYQASELNGDLNIWVDKFNGSFMLEEWKHEYTCFRYDDILTILACMSIFSKKSIFTNFTEAIAFEYKSPATLPNISNPEAKGLNGNHLEVLTSLVVIDASHTFSDENSFKFSLSGQSCAVFIKNILLNCTNAEIFCRNANIQLNFYNHHDFEIEEFLEKLTVPFLCPFNSKIPEFLAKLNSKSMNDESIHVGTYDRTPNSTKIDAVFDMYFNERITKNIRKSERESISSSQAFKGIIECKNWALPVKSKDILSILNRVIENEGQHICFIFCNSITNPEKEYEPLLKLCNEQKIIISCFTKNQNLSFNVIPYHSSYLQFDTNNPKLICFVFELNEINKNV